MVKFKPLLDSSKTIMEVGNITKATTFESFRHLSCKNMQLRFFCGSAFQCFHGANMIEKKYIYISKRAVGKKNWKIWDKQESLKTNLSGYANWNFIKIETL